MFASSLAKAGPHLAAVDDDSSRATTVRELCNDLIVKLIIARGDHPSMEQSRDRLADVRPSVLRTLGGRFDVLCGGVASTRYGGFFEDVSKGLAGDVASIRSALARVVAAHTATSAGFDQQLRDHVPPVDASASHSATTPRHPLIARLDKLSTMMLDAASGKQPATTRPSPLYFPSSIVEHVWGLHARAASACTMEDVAVCAAPNARLLGGMLFRRLCAATDATNMATSSTTARGLDAVAETVGQLSEGIARTLLVFLNSLETHLVECYYGGDGSPDSQAIARRTSLFILGRLPILFVLERALTNSCISGGGVVPPTCEWIPYSQATRDLIFSPNDGDEDEDDATSRMRPNALAALLLIALLVSTSSSSDANVQHQTRQMMSAVMGVSSDSTLLHEFGGDVAMQPPSTSPSLLAKAKAAAHASTRARNLLLSRKLEEKKVGRHAYKDFLSWVFPELCGDQAKHEENAADGDAACQGVEVSEGRGSGSSCRRSQEANVAVPPGSKRPRSLSPTACIERGEGDITNLAAAHDQSPRTGSHGNVPTQTGIPHVRARELYRMKQALTRSQNATSAASARVRSLLLDLDDALLTFDDCARDQAAAERAFIEASVLDKVEHTCLRDVY